MKKNKKFIFVTGGVVSSIGKGLAAASLGALLEARGLKVTIMKFDPYLNVDPGTMSPFQHGEVYVTDDGAETDLDLGHYERYTRGVMTRANSVSAGQIYEAVISKERRGEYLGGTVQVIPHVTDEIKKRMHEVSKNYEVTIVEIGGTVGDIESQPFIEAIRQMRLDQGANNTVLMHVTYIPYIAAAGELKSKPTQHSVKELRSLGLQPDILVCRTEKGIDDNLKKKIGLFCSVETKFVISAPDSKSIYEVPLALHQEKLDVLVLELFDIRRKQFNITGWKNVCKAIRSPEKQVRIAVVGKYVNLKESYKSLNEALVHASIANKTEILIDYIDSEKITQKNVEKLLQNANGILIPGGFGSRGIEGKIKAIEFARTNQVPFFGICLGMQLMAIEYARNVCGLEKATSREFIKKNNTDAECIVDFMEEQKNITNKGGTMRLGSYTCHVSKNTLGYKLYKASVIKERHRHRYEINNKYRDLFVKNGVVFSGIFKEKNLVEMMEIKNHPFYIGVQSHPEFKSKPLAPHPIFNGFIKASLALNK